MLEVALLPLAHATTCRSFDHDVAVDAGVVPRNVRYLEQTLSSVSYHVPGEPRARVERASDRPFLELRHAPFGPDRDYRVVSPNDIDIVRFRTGTRVDRKAPVGGDLLGASPGFGAMSGFTLLFTPVSDASPVWAEVESRAVSAPDAVVRSIGYTSAIWEPTPPARRALPLRSPRWSPYAAFEAAGLARPVVFVDMEVEFPCGGAPHGFASLARGAAPDDLVSFRARWLDAAGNTSPWSGWLRLPGREEIVWVDPD